ncbi:MAG TPA: hypothetical protein VKM72_35090 [Thermoanaerobaculia bacterium]|nr:hypothetical protein [Thermoanaerobaculia bacterium]
MNRLISRSLVVALVFCFSFAGVVYANGGAAASSPTVGVWDLILDTWNTLSKLWQKEGSSLDPFGTPPITNSDAGSSLDPFGKP